MGAQSLPWRNVSELPAGVQNNPALRGACWQDAQPVLSKGGHSYCKMWGHTNMQKTERNYIQQVAGGAKQETRQLRRGRWPRGGSF